MLLYTTWKMRPLTPEQTERMMAIWAEQEAAADTSQRLCWFMLADGSGGFSVDNFADDAAAFASGLEASLALGEFLELETRPVMDLESALPAIMAAVERITR